MCGCARTHVRVRAAPLPARTCIKVCRPRRPSCQDVHQPLPVACAGACSWVKSMAPRLLLLASPCSSAAPSTLCCQTLPPASCSGEHLPSSPPPLEGGPRLGPRPLARPVAMFVSRGQRSAAPGGPRGGGSCALRGLARARRSSSPCRALRASHNGNTRTLRIAGRWRRLEGCRTPWSPSCSCGRRGGTSSGAARSSCTPSMPSTCSSG